ncbi:MAG TPA: protein-glutamate O-methyltransferase CheR [Candidatus Acidoferrum sp.]|nr:protein-glutamate O-methyltransferase CheR [Candidatus Acidoferrum sp.]
MARSNKNTSASERAPRSCVSEKSDAEPLDVFLEFQPKTITEREFLRFQELIHRVSGIWLTHAKSALLVGRLSKRLRHLGLTTFSEYYRAVTTDPEEQTCMLDAISTNETRFFREPGQFEFLRQRVFPQWQTDAARRVRARRIRAWSAGCSTGQEPYSLAMALCHHFPAAAGWEIEIVATDLSNRALDIARGATWELGACSEIPEAYLKAYMLRGCGRQEGKIKAGPEIRAVVSFLRLNLNDQAYAMNGLFDLIFCRNVLIYFDREDRERIVRRLLSYLSPSGYLFVGHAESLHAMHDVVRSVITTVYAPIVKVNAEADVAR